MKIDGIERSFLRKTKVVTAEQMRSLDRSATEEYGIPSMLLMENAGRAVFQAAVDLLGSVSCKRALVIAGQGNNGGDGFVAARHLHNAGARVTVAYFGDRGRAKGDALANIEIAERMGLKIEHHPEWNLFESFDADVVVDSLLGTGVSGDVREPLSNVLMSAALSTFLSRAVVVAVDIPSGIDSDTGMKLTPHPVRADVTVTFALPKVGLLTGDAVDYVGRLVIADIGIPHRTLIENDAQTYVVDKGTLTDIAPCAPGALVFDRQSSSHKGTYGHVAIIAGSVGLTGAATLAAEGALRIGTGLVTVACPESLNDILEVKLTEAMTIPVPEGSGRAFGMASLRKVLEIIEKRDAVVLGPGFGRDDDTVSFTLELIPKLDKPTIIDADALYAISKDLSVLKRSEAPLVITPHPGEMATLLGTSAAEVQSNRLESAREFAKQHGVTVVLKGAGTVIAEPDGTAYINTTGTPGMATGGTGDVLSGMIGGLLAQEVGPVEAACAAVYLHGRAGELAAETLGESAMLASDLADYIGDAIQEVQSDT